MPGCQQDREGPRKALEAGGDTEELATLVPAALVLRPRGSRGGGGVWAQLWLPGSAGRRVLLARVGRRTLLNAPRGPGRPHRE